MNAPESRGRRATVAWAAAALLLAAGATVALGGCRSMDKDVLTERLLALSKNEPVRRAGLLRREADVVLDGRAARAELRYVHVPRRTAPAPGEAHRPPLVLVHGTPSSLFTWTELVFGGEGFAVLADDFDVYLLDVVGHGVTRTTAPPYGFQRCADWVAAFLALLGEPVILVGHSYGGEFCWRAALDHPARVARLVLVDSSGYARADDEWLPEERAMRSIPGARFGWLLNSRERVANALAPHFRGPLEPERLEEIYLVCSNADNWRAMVDLARDENGTRANELGRLEPPLLLVWGAEDIAYPPERFAERFVRDVPGAVLHVVPECGHYPQEERPAALAGLLREALLPPP